MGLFGPFHDPLSFAEPIQARPKLEPMPQRNASSQVMWEVGLVLVSVLAVAAIVGELLERFHLN